MAYMITERQEKLLNFLVKEYLAKAEPISSKLLKRSADLDVCEATVRNDLQALAEAGYIGQPHTSAGRIPTRKAYQYFADKIEKQRENEFQDFIMRQIGDVHAEIEREMKFAEELMKSLEKDNLFQILTIIDAWHKKTKN